MDSLAQLMRILRELDQNMTPWLSFDKMVLRTSGMIYVCVSYAVLLQGTMELAMEGSGYSYGPMLITFRLFVRTQPYK